MDVAMEANWGKKNQTANNVSANDCTGGDEKYRRHKLVKQEIWAAATIWGQKSKHTYFAFFPLCIDLVKLQIFAGCWGLFYPLLSKYIQKFCPKTLNALKHWINNKIIKWWRFRRRRAGLGTLLVGGIALKDIGPSRLWDKELQSFTQIKSCPSVLYHIWISLYQQGRIHILDVGRTNLWHDFFIFLQRSISFLI